MAIVIFLVVAAIGAGLFFVISEGSRENLRQYDVAYKTEVESEFQHAKETRLGNVLAAGTFSAVNPVSDDRIEGKYLSIKVVTERYNMHTRIITDSKGRTSTETYYSWDYEGVEYNQSETFTFLGLEGTTDEIPNLYSYIDTVYPEDTMWHWVGDIRYEISAIPSEFYGTGFWALTSETHLKNLWLDKSVSDCLGEMRSQDNIKNGVFIVFWSLFTITCAGWFISKNNAWLVDSSRK